MLNIGLLGFGVVGQGVYHQVCSRSDLAIRRILVRRSREEIEALAARDIREIVEDDSIHIVVEVMGGLHPAYEYICAALEAGKHVVTANKAVISAYYRELTELAVRKGVALRCTAAAGGGIAMGLVGGKAADGISRQPEMEGKIRTSLMLTMVFIETAIIYALLVVILVIFVL